MKLNLTDYLSIYDNGIIVSGGNIMSGDTKTMIGSTTKSFIGLLASQLAAKKVLDLDEPIIQYLGNSVVELDYIENGNLATLATLLNHNAGIYDPTALEYEPFSTVSTHFNDAINYKNNIFIDAFSITYAYDKPSPYPINTFEYSNAGYWLAGLSIEEKAVDTLSNLINQEIIKPLGLLNTYYAINETSNIIAGTYDMNQDGILDDVSQWKYMNAGNAAGGIISTTNDLAYYISAIAQKDKRIIDNKIDMIMNSHTIKQNHIDFEGLPLHQGDYRLGLFYDKENDILSHGGVVFGYITFMAAYLNKPVSMAGNVAHVDGSELLYDLASELQNKLFTR